MALGGVVGGDELAAASATAVGLLREAESLRAEAVSLLVEFDEADGHVELGFVSPQRHLAFEAKLTNDDADRLVRAIRHCGRHTLTADALAAGSITVGHVDVLARLSSGLTFEFSESEYELLSLADGRDLGGFERVVKAWRWQTSSGAAESDTAKAFDERSLTLQPNLFGGCRGRFQLDAAGHEILSAALETKPDSVDALEAPRTLRQRRADALVDLADTHLNRANLNGTHSDDFVGGDPTGGRSSGGRSVDVVLDIRSLVGDPRFDVAGIRAELTRTGEAPKHVLEEFMCDASWRRLITDGPNIVLNYGTATPSIPTGLRRAIQRRDRCCRFRGCNRSWQWCDVHHLLPVNEGGPTNERNLALVCRFHHRLIHQAGWRLEWDPLADDFITTSP